MFQYGDIDIKSYGVFVFFSLFHGDLEANPMTEEMHGHFLENRRIFGKNKKIADPY
ncbi:hypothetical protein [Bartonella sp. AP9QHHD]|uniref:hypothetical protein n=1 Tax=Bartonella sp. AP9QHHD TaxID=3243507 RepID=UPI0035D06723